MANKLTNCVGKIVTAMAALVTAKTLKAVTRKLIIPAEEHNPPVLGIVISNFHRESQTWIAEVLLMLVAVRGADNADEAIIKLAVAVDDCIIALKDSGLAGGVLDRPDWEMWYAAHGQDTGLQQVGALGSMRIRVVDPLTVT